MKNCLQDVIEVSKKYLPRVAEGYNSPKVTVHIGDGIEYLEKFNDEFDVIITDSSDPLGNCIYHFLFIRSHISLY